MLPTAIFILFIAAVLLAFALRGRIIDRGAFCRRCRFDLIGIDAADPVAKCPECGAGLATPKAIRPSLRRRRPVVLTLAVVLLLAGVGLAGIVTSNNTARVMAALPDRLVLTLHALEMDAAFTEIATNRLARNKPLSESTWDGLIADALAHQSNTRLSWDPRHGEVLANALVDARLTDEQAGEYVRLAVGSKAQFPETLRHGAKLAGMLVMYTNSARAAALNRVSGATYGPDQLRIWMTVTKAGTVDPDYETELSSQSGGMFTIPGPGPGSAGATQSSFPLDDFDWSRVEAGSEITLFVEYVLTVVAEPSNEVIASWTTTDRDQVRVLGPQGEVVRLNTDPAVIDSFRMNSHARLTPIYIPPPGERTAYGDVVIVAETDFVASRLPVGLSGDLYVIHGGRETRFCGVNAAASAYGMSAVSVGWRADANEGVDEALLQSWLDASAVTVEYRPAPHIAEKTHDIREILGVPLRFTGVPVTDIKPARKGFGVTPAETDTIARPLDAPTDD